MDYFAPPCFVKNKSFSGRYVFVLSIIKERYLVRANTGVVAWGVLLIA